MATLPETSQTKTKDELINEILTCGICLSRMSSPCCLPCAHSFCRTCLLDYAENTSTMINYILCPYCKYQFNFRSIEHLESLLIINPIMKQLCDVLDTAKVNGTHRARCHTCCLLKMLKICKHCHFMLCEACRRIHLLDVHRESKLQLDLLDSNLHLISEKYRQMEKIKQEYDDMREMIQKYVDEMFYEIEQQRDQALQIIDERQHENEEAFWNGNGFDNREKLEFFISLADCARKKLSAKNITDRDLMELSDNLQTIPDIDEKTFEAIDFKRLELELDQTFPMPQLIRVNDSSTAINKLTNDNQQT